MLDGPLLLCKLTTKAVVLVSKFLVACLAPKFHLNHLEHVDAGDSERCPSQKWWYIAEGYLC